MSVYPVIREITDKLMLHRLHDTFVNGLTIIALHLVVRGYGI